MILTKASVAVQSCHIGASRNTRSLTAAMCCDRFRASSALLGWTRSGCSLSYRTVREPLLADLSAVEKIIKILLELIKNVRGGVGHHLQRSFRSAIVIAVVYEGNALDGSRDFKA
jgi:hypothetical protein